MTEPTPESEPVPPELERSLRAMREDVLSPEEVEALAARVVGIVTAPAPPTSGAGATAGGVSGPAAIVASSIAALVLGAGGLAYLVATTPPSAMPEVGATSSPTQPADGLTNDASVSDAATPMARGPAPGIAAEHVLLERARRLAHTDPDGALALAEEHARVAPEGVLAPEREVIAVETLHALGRDDEARVRRAAFVARWPSSPYRERLGRIQLD